MAFAFSTRPIVVDHRLENSIKQMETAEEMLDLVHTMGELDAQLATQEEFASNIEKSLTLLNTYGRAAIKQLNLDGGLESLLGKTEASITVQMATEGLGDALAKAKEAIKGVYEKYAGVMATVQKMFDKLGPILKNFDREANIETGGITYDNVRKMLLNAEHALASEMQYRETHNCADIQKAYDAAAVYIIPIVDISASSVENTTAYRLGFTDADKLATVVRQARDIFYKLQELKLDEKGELKARILKDDDKGLETYAKKTTLYFYARLNGVTTKAIYKTLALAIKFCDGKKKD